MGVEKPCLMVRLTAWGCVMPLLLPPWILECFKYFTLFDSFPSV